MDIRKSLFPKTPRWRDLQITDEAFYSVTFPVHAKIITESIADIMKKVFEKEPDDVVITDASSCVGGDAISFAETFKWVNCVEFSHDHMAMLKNNLDIYKIYNVSFYEGSYEKFCEKLKQDVVYMDPPWGGPDYMKVKKIRLKYGETAIEDLALRAKAKLIVFKLPKNYDTKFLAKKLPGIIIKTILKSSGSPLFLLCFYYTLH